MRLELLKTYTEKCKNIRKNKDSYWCDFGANLVQHFIKRYSRYSRYQTAFPKLEEITKMENVPYGAFSFFVLEAHMLVFVKRKDLWQSNYQT